MIRRKYREVKASTSVAGTGKGNAGSWSFVRSAGTSGVKKRDVQPVGTFGRALPGRYDIQVPRAVEGRDGFGGWKR